MAVACVAARVHFHVGAQMSPPRGCNVRGCTVADRLSLHRAEATRVAAIEALFASVNPSILQASDLQHALTRSLDVVASMPDRSLGVRRALYPSMGKMFGRIKETGVEVPRFDLSSLRALLFSADAEVEAVRLLRADAVVAAAKALPWLVQEVRSELEKWTAGETSKPVLDRLAGAA